MVSVDPGMSASSIFLDTWIVARSRGHWCVVRKVLSESAESSENGAVIPPNPTLTTQWSTAPPASVQTLSTAASASASSPKLPTTPTTDAGHPHCARVASSFACDLLVTTTFAAPSAANACATPAPTFPVPPKTTQTFPARRFAAGFSPPGRCGVFSAMAVSFIVRAVLDLLLWNSVRSRIIRLCGVWTEIVRLSSQPLISV